MGTSEFDWERVQKKFEELRFELGCWRLFGDEEFERIKLSRLTFGLMEAGSWDQVDFGTAVYVAQKHGGVKLDAMVQVALEVGVQISPSLLPPEYIIKNREYPDHFGRIEAAIKKRTPSNEFLESWTRRAIRLS